MKNLLPCGLLSASVLMLSYLSSSSNVRADDWGCQVIICLSNPGGPTQYTECRPPIQKLWRHLAKGRSFPICSGVGFQTERPGYEPYYCDTGYRLLGSYGPRRDHATCISSALQRVDRSLCSSDRVNTGDGSNSVVSAHWLYQHGTRQCMGYANMRPKIRSQPHYIDVTIDNVGKQRVWY